MKISESNTMSERAGLSDRMFIRQECLFWTTAVLLLYLFLWYFPFTDAEISRAEITREMMMTGRWLHPALNGTLIPGVSALSYWCTVPFIKLFGAGEFALRLPAALAALGALYALKLLAGTLFDRRVAVVSGWFFLGSAGFLLNGRTASADMFTVTTVLFALWWYFRIKENCSFWRYLLFYLLCFGGALFNSTAAFVLPFLIVFCHFLSKGSGKKHLNWKNPAALLCGAGLCLLYVYIVHFLLLTPGFAFAEAAVNLTETFRNGIILHYQNVLQLQENWYLSWRDLFFGLLPWILLLPVGIAGILKNRKNLPEGTAAVFAGVCIAFLLSALFAPGSTVNTAVLTPCLLLFSAAGLNGNGVESWNKVIWCAAFYICIIVSSLCICSIITYPLWERIADYTPPTPAVLAPVAAGALCWLLLFMDHRPGNSLSRLIGLPHHLCAVLLSGTLLSGCALSVVLPVLSGEFNVKKRFFTELYKRSSETLSGMNSVPVILFRTPAPPEYLFYNDLPVPLSCVDDLKDLLRQYPGQKVIMLFKRRALQQHFKDQCRQYGILQVRPFLVEEFSRWRAPDARNDHFVSYLITLPGQKKDIAR